jgi:curved DNA-binding protein CbpA
VIPDRSLLEELAGRFEAALDEFPFALVLAAHHDAGSSGMLRARRGRVEKRVLLDHGVPVECRSNLVHETLSRFLVAAGKLSDTASIAALGRAAARDKLLGEMLVEEGVLEADELQRLLQQNLARKLFDLFAWRDGGVHFEAGGRRSETAQRVNVPRLIVTGVERFTPQEVVDRQFAPLAVAPLALVSGHEERAAAVRATASERKLLDAVVTPRRIEELITELGESAEELARKLWAFTLVGLIAPATGAERRPAPAQPSRTEPTSAPPKLEPTPDEEVRRQEIARAQGREAERLRRRVKDAFATRESQDAFELLGVADDASLEQIRERYAACVKELGPWRFELDELAEVADQAAELFYSAALAYAELADPHRREELRIARRQKREESVRESRASYFKIETDLLDAGVQFEKGLALREARKWDLALQQFEFAVDCDPQNGAYRAEAALVRFLLAPSSMGSPALKELREAQRIDPRAPEPFLYAGKICAELSRFAEAEKHYRQAAKLLGPEDRRGLDALAELGRRKRRGKR